MLHLISAAWLQEELTADFDIGFAIKEQVIPRAVEW